jgi:hypothetical protein
MATTAQILANRQNAERSHGPVTEAGKARVSQNATKFGLFSVANFVRPEEREIFNDFEVGYLAELAPDSSLEQTLAREIIHAAWRLRRCANLEVAPPEDLTDEELDRLQISIDRARAAAQRTFHRSLKELRRLQGERLEPATKLQNKPNLGITATKQSASAPNVAQALPPVQVPKAGQGPSSQGPSIQPEVLIPRSAPCPCKSGQKYKRCCGRNAPPVRFSAAA